MGRGRASAGRGGKHAVPEFDLLARVECPVPEHPLVQFAWRAASPSPMGDHKIVEL